MLHANGLLERHLHKMSVYKGNNLHEMSKQISSKGGNLHELSKLVFFPENTF